MSNPIAPRRIEWTGPEGWTVWADEDGVHVRTPGGDGLEAPDLRRLIDLAHVAASQMASGAVPSPAPPAPEQIAAMRSDDRDRYAAKRARRAIEREFAPMPTTPF